MNLHLHQHCWKNQDRAAQTSNHILKSRVSFSSSLLRHSKKTPPTFLQKGYNFVVDSSSLWKTIKFFTWNLLDLSIEEIFAWWSWKTHSHVWSRERQQNKCSIPLFFYWAFSGDVKFFFSKWLRLVFCHYFYFTACFLNIYLNPSGKLVVSCICLVDRDLCLSRSAEWIAKKKKKDIASENKKKREMEGDYMSILFT